MMLFRFLNGRVGHYQFATAANFCFWWASNVFWFLVGCGLLLRLGLLVTGDSYDLTNPSAPPSLEVKVFSSALVGDVPLGRVEIPLDVVVSVGESFEDTYPLESFGRMKSVSGTVHLRFSFTGEKPERHTMRSEEHTSELQSLMRIPY